MKKSSPDGAKGNKICPDCGIAKRFAEFSQNKARPDGLQFYCKSCFSVRAAATYRRRRARIGKQVRERIELPDGHKRCAGCEQIKPRTEWHRNRTSRDGLVVYCKECRKRLAREQHLKRTFGLTEEQLAVMVSAQGGVCAICEVAKPIHTDHDHVTGRVRGVLCGPCNMGLGQFADDPRRLQAAIEYLVEAKFAEIGAALVVTPVEQEIYVDYTHRHAA